MKKILIIDDEVVFLKIIHEFLSKNGYEVIEAHNGEEGLKMAVDVHPDLILLDIKMPKMGGIEMLHALNKSSTGKDVPVFILSNVNESNITTEAIYSHASKYFIKSELKLEDLLEIIQMYIGKEV